MIHRLLSAKEVGRLLWPTDGLSAAGIQQRLYRRGLREHRGYLPNEVANLANSVADALPQPDRAALLARVDAALRDERRGEHRGDTTSTPTT